MHVIARVSGCIRSRALVFALAPLLVAACGGAGVPPTISELTLQQASVAPGARVDGQLRISDPDGLDGAQLSIGIAEQAALAARTPVLGATSGLTEALVPFALQLNPAIPPGRYTLRIEAIDGDDNTSNALDATLEVATSTTRN